MTKEEIGLVLKQLRISCGMTQKEVAEKIGRKQQIVGHWETGYSQPDANTLFLLCDIYGTSVDEAFGFSKNNNVSNTEYDIVKKYRTLDSRGKDIVNTVLNREVERMAELKEEDSIPERPKKMPEISDADLAAIEKAAKLLRSKKA